MPLNSIIKHKTWPHNALTIKDGRTDKRQTKRQNSICYKSLLPHDSLSVYHRCYTKTEQSWTTCPEMKYLAFIPPPLWIHWCVLTPVIPSRLFITKLCFCFLNRQRTIILYNQLQPEANLHSWANIFLKSWKHFSSALVHYAVHQPCGISSGSKYRCSKRGEKLNCKWLVFRAGMTSKLAIDNKKGCLTSRLLKPTDHGCEQTKKRAPQKQKSQLWS